MVSSYPASLRYLIASSTKSRSAPFPQTSYLYWLFVHRRRRGSHFLKTPKPVRPKARLIKTTSFGHQFLDELLGDSSSGSPVEPFEVLLHEEADSELSEFGPLNEVLLEDDVFL